MRLNPINQTKTRTNPMHKYTPLIILTALFTAGCIAEILID